LISKQRLISDFEDGDRHIVSLGQEVKSGSIRESDLGLISSPKTTTGCGHSENTAAGGARLAKALISGTSN